MQELLVQQSQYAYTGFFAHPLLALLQRLSIPAGALQEAFEYLGFGLEAMQIQANSQAVNEHSVDYYFGYGSYRFKLDRVEATFWNLDRTGLDRVPQILASADQALRRVSSELKIRSHQFAYSAHCLVKDGIALNVLGSLSTRRIEARWHERGHRSHFSLDGYRKGMGHSTHARLVAHGRRGAFRPFQLDH